MLFNPLKPLPADLRQFRITDILKITFATAIAVVAWPHIPLLSFAIAGVLVGLTLIFISDSLDRRAFIQRNLLSSGLSATGILLIAICFAFGIAVLLKSLTSLA